MTRSSWLFGALALVLFPLLAGAQDKEPKYVITCATIAPDGSSWMKILSAMDQELRKRTGGELGIRFYAGGIQGQEPTVVAKMRGGQLAAAGLTGTGLGDLYPDIRVLEAPLLIRTHAEYDYVRNKLWKTFLKELYKRGYLLLGMTEGGWAYMYSRNEISDLASLRSTKVWLRQGDPLLEGALTHLQLNSVPLAVADVLTSLQTSRIESIYVSPLALRAFQWSDKVSYMMDVPLFNITAGLVYSKAEFKKLPKPYQKVLRLVTYKYHKELTADTRRQDAESLEALSKKGIKTLKPTPEQLAEFRASCKAFCEASAGKIYSKEIYEQVVKHLAEYRAKGGQ